MSDDVLNFNDFLNEAKKKKKKSSKKVSSKKSKTKIINHNYYSSNLGYGLAGIRPSYYLPSSSPNIINNNINNNITTGGNHDCDSGMSPSPSPAPSAPITESLEFKYLKKFSLEEDSE